MTQAIKVSGPAGEQGKELVDLLDRCNVKKPKSEDIRALRKKLAEVPDLWRVSGDMAELAATATIQGLNAHPAVKESIRAGRLAMRQELGFERASALEKMLIDHVVLCWLRLQIVEYRYTQVLSESVTLAVGDYWERRLSATQRRYLRACETLARIRRLALPVMQVNIADKQVNIAGQ